MSFALKGMLFVIVAACVAAIVLRRTRASSDSSGTAGSSTAVESDAQALRDLQKAGLDLTKKTEVRYYLYFPDKASADRAAFAIKNDSTFDAEVLGSRGGTDWTCLVTATMVPSESAIAAATKKFSELTSSLGGRYGGWQAQNDR